MNHQSLLWILIYISIFSIIIGKSLPYQKLRICNDNDFTAAMYLKVQYRENAEHVWNLEESFPPRSCSQHVSVLPKVEYAIAVQYDGVDQSGSQQLQHFLKVRIDRLLIETI